MTARLVDSLARFYTCIIS